MQELVVEIPETEWLTSNQRLHHHDKARRTKLLRHRVKMLAEHNLYPVPGPVRLDVTVYYRAGRGLDDDNAQPSVKAIKDALTDAGIWEDDRGKWVRSTTYHASKRDPQIRKGWHRIVVGVTEE